ncbi:hypothetical protein Ddc_09737 [Ditylenchus destructor]|nr:hypothetical protein Ddc_09737 [Ditylenchus destructor]
MQLITTRLRFPQRSTKRLKSCKRLSLFSRFQKRQSVVVGGARAKTTKPVSKPSPQPPPPLIITFFPVVVWGRPSWFITQFVSSRAVQVFFFHLLVVKGRRPQEDPKKVAFIGHDFTVRSIWLPSMLSFHNNFISSFRLIGKWMCLSHLSPIGTECNVFSLEFTISCLFLTSFRSLPL